MSKKKYTVWHLMPDPATYFHEYEDEFVDQFRLKAVKKKKAKAKAGKESFGDAKEGDETKKVKKEIVTILDGKRQQALMILSSKLPKVSILLRQILRTEELSHEAVEGLLKRQPQAEEIQAIESMCLEGNQVWGKMETLLLTLWTIPKLSLRLECWDFMFEFESSLQRIQDCCDCHNEACLQLVQSNALHDIISLLLTCGNYMNANNNRKRGADGFKIDALLKLDSMKGKSMNENFLQFIAKVAKKRIPNCQLLTHEFRQVSKAGNTLTLQELKIECTTFSASFKKVDLAQNMPKHNEDDLFSEKCRAFVEEKRPQVDSMLVVLDQTIKNFNDTLRFFSWKCPLDESPSFYKIFTEFASKFTKAMPVLKYKKTAGRKKYKKGDRIDVRGKAKPLCTPEVKATDPEVPIVLDMDAKVGDISASLDGDPISPQLKGLLRRHKRKTGKRSNRKKESILLKTIEHVS